MKPIVLFLFALFFFASVSAVCNEGQIDINTASLEELDKLNGIGPVYAQRIIDNRTFNNVDELIRVKGIGEITLQKIKSQGLACVSSEVENNNNEEKEEIEENSVNTTSAQQNQQTNLETIKQPAGSAPVQAQVINLNSKDIKSDEDSEKTGENYAIYWLISFSILIGVLFALRKNKYKNEFR